MLHVLWKREERKCICSEVSPVVAGSTFGKSDWKEGTDVESGKG